MLPKLVVFDCDMCLWSPECFEISPPFQPLNEHVILANNRSIQVKLFPGAIQAFRDILQLPEFKSTKVALASTTRYPAYSTFLRENFQVLPGIPISKAVVSVQVFYAYDKIGHFENIRKETGIAYEDMLFFDDCIWGDNVGDVETGCPGVVGVRTPKGLTVEAWKHGLQRFSEVKSRDRR
jgi:magnesium-dependent phosphatase 1